MALLLFQKLEENLCTLWLNLAQRCCPVGLKIVRDGVFVFFHLDPVFESAIVFDLEEKVDHVFASLFFLWVDLEGYIFVTKSICQDLLLPLLILHFSQPLQIVQKHRRSGQPHHQHQFCGFFLFREILSKYLKVLRVEVYQRFYVRWVDMAGPSVQEAGSCLKKVTVRQNSNVFFQFADWKLAEYLMNSLLL